MTNILQRFRHTLLNLFKHHVDLYDFDLVYDLRYLKIISPIYCVKMECEATTMIKITKSLFWT